MPGTINRFQPAPKQLARMNGRPQPRGRIPPSTATTVASRFASPGISVVLTETLSPIPQSRKRGRDPEDNTPQICEEGQPRKKPKDELHTVSTPIVDQPKTTDVTQGVGFSFIEAESKDNDARRKRQQNNDAMRKRAPNSMQQNRDRKAAERAGVPQPKKLTPTVSNRRMEVKNKEQQQSHSTGKDFLFIAQGEKRKPDDELDGDVAGSGPKVPEKKRKASHSSGKEEVQRQLEAKQNILAESPAGVAANQTRNDAIRDKKQHTQSTDHGCESTISETSNRDVETTQKTLDAIKARAAANQARKAALLNETTSAQKVCSHFLRGSCRFGNACRKTHSIRPPPKTNAEIKADLEALKAHKAVPEEGRDRIWYLQELANLRDHPAFDDIRTWCPDDLSTREQVKYWTAIFRKLLDTIDSLHAWDSIDGTRTTTDGLSDLGWRCRDLTRLRTVLAISIDAEASMCSRLRRLARLQVDVNDFSMKLGSGTPFPDEIDELVAQMSMLVLKHAASPLDMKEVNVGVSKVFGSPSFITWLGSRFAKAKPSTPQTDAVGSNRQQEVATTPNHPPPEVKQVQQQQQQARPQTRTRRSHAPANARTVPRRSTPVNRKSLYTQVQQAPTSRRAHTRQLQRINSILQQN
ncbi:hypothetical protein BDV96DRAFT_630790 [Lophiotrema nucula]|uniref:C3H1-type domain-containing protein n=1 Tax=Lophiotrema nucula TaxID=690887 RepID=A0A6A5ZCZ2_9PLEO|nr:hypothetical protein BDV96DRAFT_630790 [Lophiotrema nucula]